jgi:serine/threonine protein kinase
LSKTLEADSKLTLTGTYLGTPYYSSPEQVRGRGLDFRSDMYSLAATLYALLTGKPPFGASQAGEALARIVAEEPTPFSEHKVDVPKGLQQVVLRALAKDKEKRYATYADFRAALMPYSSEGLEPTTRGKRFAAIIVDILALMPLEALLEQLTEGPLEGVLIAALVFLVAGVIYSIVKPERGIPDFVIGTHLVPR